MEYEIIENDDIMEIRVKGRLDTATAPVLEEALSGRIGETSKRIVLDACELNYVSSAGLRTLLAFSKLTAGKGGVTLRNVSEDVMEIFGITGFDAILQFE